MNCKPGDLAVVVSDDLHLHTGKVVRCVGSAPEARPRAGFHWFTEPQLIDPDGCLFAPNDRRLRPIRDPGDDAVDETLLWLPAPKEKTACPYSPHKETA